MNPVISACLLSLRVCLLAMFLIVPVGLLMAWRLVLAGRFRGRAIVETLLFLPIVLPPTVVGFGLLMIFGRGTIFGRYLQDTLHISLLFTWQSAAIASAIMALPLFVRSAVGGKSGEVPKDGSVWQSQSGKS